MTIQQAPFLRNQRNFPYDTVDKLSTEIDRSYIDIASKVNARTIGLFAVNFPVVTGEEWFITGESQKQQTLRQLYIGSGLGSFPHGISFAQLTAFTRIYGTFLSNTGTWYTLPYVDPANVKNQVAISVDSTNLNIFSGGGSTVVTTWYVVLEWLSQF